MLLIHVMSITNDMTCGCLVNQKMRFVQTLGHLLGWVGINEEPDIRHDFQRIYGCFLVEDFIVFIDNGHFAEHHKVTNRDDHHHRNLLSFLDWIVIPNVGMSASWWRR